MAALNSLASINFTVLKNIIIDANTKRNGHLTAVGCRHSIFAGAGAL
jgi:hypothetical protein